eukprot:CAMPEP_0196584598 /NCGR_PEP_ID=MMETSP1081-20130531/47705_1 /TAXON_ID=36882 /ORGANISM="Pyramimonas amylifera, Strain CCMP720" /LENGTH=115 /DNA_ID=CAMNT_0041905859 /DNA_START=220 /DNA_END=564 /DNA_ORIENTATION=+
MKQKMLSLCEEVTGNGVTASEDLCSRICSAVDELDMLNPTVDPASMGAQAGALDGTWGLAFTTNKETSAGKIGPFVGTVTQEVQVGIGKYVNRVSLGPVSLALTAHWEVLDGENW